jgi:hypothetical protein
MEENEKMRKTHANRNPHLIAFVCLSLHCKAGFFFMLLILHY